MQYPRNPFDRSFAPEKKPLLPVKAPGQKLKIVQPGKTQYFVKSVSSPPLANDTSKEEIRMNYLQGVIQGRIHDTRFSQTGGLPKMSMGPNSSSSMGMAPSQVSINTFMKPSGFPQTHQFQQFGMPQSSIPTLHVPNQKYNNSLAINNGNPFMIKQNQLQSNNCSNQAKNITGMSGLSIPGLMKQPSFGVGLVQRIFDGQGSTGPAFGGLNVISKPMGASTNIQVPGQLLTSPSFGTLTQSNQPQTGSMFGQSISQPQQNYMFNSQPANPIMVSHTTSLQTGLFAPSSNPPNPQSTPNPLSLQQVPATTLDQNIKQLLESKPNLWNILSLDPQYRYGFNESGRMYVKSVLQRIIDENILSEESLNKVIVQIYKQMYGAENFEKILQSKKKQILHDDKISNWKINELLGKQFNKNMTQSVFPKDIDSIGQDFYRSFKRRSTKFFDELPVSIKKDGDEYERRLERKFFQVKRPTKPMELKVKFVQVNRPESRGKVIESPYNAEGLDKIAETINEIRTQHRKQIMPTQEELPNIEGFSISPSLSEIRRYTKYELQSVSKVTISNEWGSIRFKAAISLLNKNLSQSLVINQKSVEIMDEEWKVRDAEITFKKFVDFSQLQEQDQEVMEDKIIAWCEKEKFELIRIDRNKGQVVIEV